MTKFKGDLEESPGEKHSMYKGRHGIRSSRLEREELRTERLCERAAAQHASAGWRAVVTVAELSRECTAERLRRQTPVTESLLLIAVGIGVELAKIVMSRTTDAYSSHLSGVRAYVSRL